jgi:hypothetical protein
VDPPLSTVSLSVPVAAAAHGLGEPRLADDGEPEGRLEDLLGKQRRPHAQVEAGHATREGTAQIHTSSGYQDVHHRQVVRLPLGPGRGGPSRPDEAHTVAVVAEKAGEGPAAVGVRLDEEDGVGRGHAGSRSNCRTTVETLKRKDLPRFTLSPVRAPDAEADRADTPPPYSEGGAWRRTWTSLVWPRRQTLRVTTSPGR